MAHDIVRENSTPADQVRQLLDQAERTLPMLRAQGTAASALLTTFDQLWAQLPALEQNGMDLRAERGRWEALQRALRARTRWVVPAIAAWDVARQQAQAEPARWWWYLDQTLMAERRRTWRRRLTIVGAVTVLGVVTLLLLRHFFPQDPNVAAAEAHRQQAEHYIQVEDWAGAFTQYEQAIHLTPAEPDLLIWLGVLREQMGEPQAAEPWYDQARLLIADPVRFYVERAFIYLQIQRAAEGERDARAALALNDRSPQAYYVLANAAEMQERLDEAIEAYKRTAVLADEDDPNLAALARVRMAMLLQAAQMQSMQPPSPTP